MNKILLLEDDKLFGETLVDFLQSEGYRVDAAMDGEKALELTYKNRYSIYLLDVKVPLINGFDFLKSLRESGDMMPAIFITSLDTKDALSRGFQSGCDDYIKKPFDLDELLLRIKAVLKRTNNNQEELQIDKHIFLSPESLTLKIDDKQYKIAPLECELLKLLVAGKNRVVLKDEIYDALWGGKENSGALRVYVSKLNMLFGKAKIDNVRGVGYLLR